MKFSRKQDKTESKIGERRRMFKVSRIPLTFSRVIFEILLWVIFNFFSYIFFSATSWDSWVILKKCYVLTRKVMGREYEYFWIPNFRSLNLSTDTQMKLITYKGPSLPNVWSAFYSAWISNCDWLLKMGLDWIRLD